MRRAATSPSAALCGRARGRSRVEQRAHADEASKQLLSHAMWILPRGAGDELKDRGRYRFGKTGADGADCRRRQDEFEGVARRHGRRARAAATPRMTSLSKFDALADIREADAPYASVERGPPPRHRSRQNAPQPATAVRLPSQPPKRGPNPPPAVRLPSQPPKRGPNPPPAVRLPSQPSKRGPNPPPAVRLPSQPPKRGPNPPSAVTLHAWRGSGHTPPFDGLEARGASARGPWWR